MASALDDEHSSHPHLASDTAIRLTSSVGDIQAMPSCPTHWNAVQLYGNPMFDLLFRDDSHDVIFNWFQNMVLAYLEINKEEIEKLRKQAYLMFYEVRKNEILGSRCFDLRFEIDMSLTFCFPYVADMIRTKQTEGKEITWKTDSNSLLLDDCVVMHFHTV